MAYGAAEKGEEAPYRERRSLRALPVLIVGIGMLAMMAVATVVHMSNTSTTAAISLLTKDSQLAVSATAAGFGALGSVGKGDKNNILGSLGSLDTKLAHKQPVVEPMEGSFATGIVRMAEADAKRNLAKANKSTVSKLQEVKQIEQKELALQAQSKELRAEQVRVTEGLRKENVAYARAMAQAEAARSHAKTTLTRTVMAAKAPAVSGADASSVAKEVASMVMAAIQPELQAQQAEIAKLADAKEAQPKEAQPEEQKADFIAAKEKKVGAEQPEEKREHEPIKFDYHGQKLQPAFPEHFAKVQEERAQMKQPQMKAEKQQDSFQSELSRFMSQSRPFTHPPKKVQTLPKAEVKRVHGNRKSMEDYKQHVDERYTDAGEGAYGHGIDADWDNEHAKGSPCNVGGSCNHYAEGNHFNLQDHEHWRKHFLKRYKKACEDGNGNLLEGEEPCEADDEDAEEKPEEDVHIGDEQVMRSLDDYVPPNDAYVHNLLTSGTYGFDHFGHLRPNSKENYNMMYGEDSQENLKNSFGHALHSPGRGGLDHVDREDREDDVKLGDDQVGDDDEEVPTALTMPMFPGPDPDHFDHWHWKSALNQELLNGRYWKRLKKDGMMDRIIPAGEAYSGQIADGHDRHPIADLAVGSWNQGFGYGQSKEEPYPFVHARKETHGDHWRDRVFTGTHEDMEMEKGVVRNMIHAKSYFKTQPSSRPVLHTQSK